MGIGEKLLNTSLSTLAAGPFCEGTKNEPDESVLLKLCNCLFTQAQVTQAQVVTGFPHLLEKGQLNPASKQSGHGWFPRHLTFRREHASQARGLAIWCKQTLRR
jgi:hypothetical protein